MSYVIYLYNSKNFCTYCTYSKNEKSKMIEKNVFLNFKFLILGYILIVHVMKLSNTICKT